MALATIQFSQVSSPAAGESVLGFSKTGIVMLTDAGGPGAISYSWSVQQVPAPLAAFPTVTSPATQVATINPATLPGSQFVDGLYVVKLIRNDAVDGFTTDTKFFGVSDEDGFHLPTASVNRNMSNIGGSLDAQRAGWFGSTIGATNSLLDAFLRLRKSREGQYLGRFFSTTHVAAAPASETVTAGVSQSFRRITMIGTGTFTSNLADPAVEVNRTVTYQVLFSTGAGNFIVKTVSGVILLTLPAPSFVASTYNIVFKSDGVTWQLYDLNVTDLSINQGVGLLRQKVRTDIPFVSTLATTDRNTFVKIGSVAVNANLFPASAVARLEATLNVATGTAECRLFNVTAGATVGPTISAAGTTPVKVVSTTFALTAGDNLYEVQLRDTTSSFRAFCSHAQVVVQWG